MKAPAEFVGKKIIFIRLNLKKHPMKKILLAASLMMFTFCYCR